MLLQMYDAKFICCGTFLVSRDRVHARPREMYEALFSYIRDSVRASNVGAAFGSFTAMCAHRFGNNTCCVLLR